MAVLGFAALFCARTGCSHHTPMMHESLGALGVRFVQPSSPRPVGGGKNAATRVKRMEGIKLRGPRLLTT
eukprot:2429645-Prymnesium_polylepis.1